MAQFWFLLVFLIPDLFLVPCHNLRMLRHHHLLRLNHIPDLLLQETIFLSGESQVLSELRLHVVDRFLGFGQLVFPFDDDLLQVLKCVLESSQLVYIVSFDTLQQLFLVFLKCFKLQPHRLLLWCHLQQLRVQHGNSRLQLVTCCIQFFSEIGGLGFQRLDLWLGLLFGHFLGANQVLDPMLARIGELLLNEFFNC